MNPSVSSWATPWAPVRVNAAWVLQVLQRVGHRLVVGGFDALDTSTGAIAHSADTDFTGVKVRSYPATEVVSRRLPRAMKPLSSRGSSGGRPYCSSNISRAIAVRIARGLSSGWRRSIAEAG